MPLDRFVLILVIAIVAAGLTVWLGVFVAASWELGPMAGLIVIPVALIAYIGWRVIADRLNNPEDDHYDKIDK